MSQPSSDSIDFQVRSRSGGLCLIDRRAAQADPALLDPGASRDWGAAQERAEGVIIPDGVRTVRVVLGSLDWSDWDGLVDKASWKLDLSSGALMIGGIEGGERTLALEPGRYWVTLYSFARGDDGAGEFLVQLQQAEDDGDFLRTSLQWMPEPTSSHDEPLAMRSEETGEIPAYDEEETEELLAMGGDPLDDDGASDELLISLQKEP